MATTTLNATNSNSVTISGFASLASATSTTSSAIDNSTNKFVSANVTVSVRTNATSGATGYLNVYLVRSPDGGTTYDGNGTSTAPAGILIGTVPLSSVANTVTTVTTFSTEPFGPLGTSWKVCVENQSGAALNASSNAVSFAGIKYDIA